MKYKISIIVIVFNVENYIRESLESIVRQNIGLDNLEVIMVDDCSTDKSGEIIDEYADKYHNFNAIHLPENSGGCGRPRNVGIKHSTGDYIMFLDSDDYYADDACDVLYNKIKENQVDIVFSKYITFTHKTENRPVYTFFNGYEEIKIDSIEDNLQILKLAPSIWTKIYRRDFIIENNLEFSEDILAEDLVFVVKSFLKAKGIIFLNNHFCYYYRIRGEDEESSLSNNITPENIFKMINGYYETYNALKANDRENFFPYIFESHLQFWTNEFMKINANKNEKIRILKKISFLFEELNKYCVKPEQKYLIPIYNNIVSKNYSEAVLMSDIILNFLKTEKDLHFHQKQLLSKIKSLESELNLKDIQFKEKLNLKNQKLKKQQIEIAELKTIRGYSKYKANNIALRIKKKVK